MASRGQGSKTKERIKAAVTALLVLLVLVFAAGLLFRLTGGGGNEPARVEKIELDKESIIFGGGG